MASQNLVLFDLDGTLTNPYVGISRCITYAMQRVGMPLDEGTDHRRFIGPPLQRTFLELCRDAETAESAVAFYRERFATVGLYENEVYPGVHEMLESLALHQLSICTSKPVLYARRIVEHFDLAKYFVSIYGSEMDGTRADKADLIAWIIENEDLRSEDCIMVGDRHHDILGAAKNGVRSLGVLWGYGTKDELLGAGAEDVFDTPWDLAGRLGSSDR